MTTGVPIEEAWAEYQRRGVGERDFAGWAGLFAEDGVYLEHGQQLRLEGRETIKGWIVDEMDRYPYLGLWMEWAIIDGNRVAFYIWNNLPDPTGTGRRFGFPNTTIMEHAGNGEWSLEIDHYNPEMAREVFGAWFAAGGNEAMEHDPSLTGIGGWSPPPGPPAPRIEIDAAVADYAAALTDAAASGDWAPWASRFTDDAAYFDHVLGRCNGRDALLELAHTHFPRSGPATPDVRYHLTDGSRVALLVGWDGTASWDMFVLLHYAGEGRWSYEEVLWNPAQASAAPSAAK